MTKLQFIRIKQNLFTSADEERRHLMNTFIRPKTETDRQSDIYIYTNENIMETIRELTKIANIIHLTRLETQLPKGFHFFCHPPFLYIQLSLRGEYRPQKSGWSKCWT